MLRILDDIGTHRMIGAGVKMEACHRVEDRSLCPMGDGPAIATVRPFMHHADNLANLELHHTLASKQSKQIRRPEGCSSPRCPPQSSQVHGDQSSSCSTPLTTLTDGFRTSTGAGAGLLAVPLTPSNTANRFGASAIPPGSALTTLCPLALSVLLVLALL